jgi:ABC-type sugar transport system ATPase subunit
MREGDTKPVLSISDTVLPSVGEPVDLTLWPGDLAHIAGFSIALAVLGIQPTVRGEVRFLGRTWEDRSVAETERDLGLVGTVINPRCHPARIWVGNLDVDENVMLAAQFAPSRSSVRIASRANELALGFGLPEGLPQGRPSATDPGDLVLSQWVRAFLRDPLRLLILENPLELAPRASVASLVREINRVRGAGCAVLWVSETIPPFKQLGLLQSADLQNPVSDPTNPSTKA